MGLLDMKLCTIRILFVLSISWSGILSCIGAEYWVSTDGSPSGSGSRDAPWSLAHALSHPAELQSGDTIWIKGGRYVGPYTSVLRGNSSLPIKVRAAAGEHVVLDACGDAPGNAALSIEGEHAWYWGLTLTNSELGDASTEKDGVYFTGANNKLINCIVVDNGGNGIGFWSSAIDSEVTGCIIYNNGYRGTDRGHGHGVYAQNSTGTKIIRDNILFHSFGIGIHAYTENGSIKGFDIEGNVFFNAGIPGSGFIERNLLVGGLQPAARIRVSGNMFYNRPQFQSKASAQFGYSITNEDLVFEDNTMVDGTLWFPKAWESVVSRGNRMYSRSQEIQLIAFEPFGNVDAPDFDENLYAGGTLAGMSFEDWKRASGQDANSTYSAAMPTQTYVVVRPNPYEEGRAHVVVMNWSGESRVEVDLSTVLGSGDRFSIRDVQHLSGDPVVDGIYSGGDVTLPMNLSVIDLPAREDSYRERLIHTMPEFGVFLVEKLPPSPNSPPELSGVGNKTVQVGGSIRFSVDARDADDSNQLVFGANGQE